MANQLSGTRRIMIAAALVALVAVGATVVVRKSIPTPSDAHSGGTPDGTSIEVGGDASHPALAARSEGPAGTVPRRTVNGRVIDAVTGKAIVGAIVVVGSLREPSGHARATTTADGAFALEGVQDGDYWVEVWHRLYRSPHADREPWEDAIGGHDAEATPPPDGTVLRVPLQPASGVWTLRLTQGREVRGVVVDEAGQGVEGAIVRVHGSGWGPEDFGWPTDANGNFDLRMDGVRAVGAQAPGRRSRWVDIPEESDRLLRIVLRREAIVRGEVRWSDGRPASGVQVRARADANRLHWVEHETGDISQPDERGAFEVRVGAGGYTLWAEHEPLDVPQTVSAEAEIYVTPGEVRTGVVLTLPTRHVVEFELMDSADRRLADESLVLSAVAEAAGATKEDPSPQRATTDTSGRTRFAVLRPGVYTLTHEPVGERAIVLWQGQVPFEGMRPCRSTASPRTRLQVRAYTTGGDLIRTFVVRATNKRAMLAKHTRHHATIEAFALDGTATVEVRGTPPLVLFVEQCDARGDRVIEPLRISGYEVLSLPPDGVVRVWLATPGQAVGRVLGAEEATPSATPVASPPGAPSDPIWRPLENVQVEFATRGDRDGQYAAVGLATTNAEGRFVLDVDRSVAGRVRAVAPAGWVAEDPPQYSWDSREIATLRLRRTSRLEGRLRVVDNIALPERLTAAHGSAVVRVSTSGGEDGQSPWTWEREAPIDADGRWSLDEVPMSVDLGVSVEVGGNAWAKAGLIPPEPLRRIRAGGPPVVIDLVPGATIRGRVRRADEAPFVATETSLSVHSASGRYISHDLRWGPEGTFEIVGLPLASVQLKLSERVAEGDGLCRVEQWILPGTANVDLVVPRLGAVSIEVLGARHRRAHVSVWEAMTLRHCGRSNIELVDNVARIEHVPADRDLVFALVLYGEGKVATCGPLRAGGNATVTMGPPAAFFLEDVERRAKCLAAAAIGCLYGVAPDGTWPLSTNDFLPALGDEEGPEGLGPPPGRYDIVELLPNGETTVLVRGIEARAHPRDPDDEDEEDDEDAQDDDR